MSSFKKSKSLGPNGWLIEFFVEFFELLGDDILKVILEIQTEGKMAGSMNATIIALIPKSSDPSSFNDFRPISLCNVLYKIKAKIIANRLKFVLADKITKNQFGFLPGRQIMDVIGISQECLHSMKIKNIKGLILKLDLGKAYDKVNWIFLRLVLLQMGFSLQMVN